MSPLWFRRALNPWPPFIGAGMKVMRVSEDDREIDVMLKLRVFNRNYFGTQFGGSLFAMTDPFHALMMLHNLGPGYVVWDKAATIRYVKPGRGDVFARFRLEEESVAQARSSTANGEKHEPTFTVSIVDRDGGIVAEVAKTLYIRRSPADAAQAANPGPAPVPREA
jgi:acyl-coenzyme A thioesterase PaaI-like protein